MNPQVDIYFADGCGRCKLGGTPQCKVRNWESELTFLRRVVLDCMLTEELKWSQPCYTFQNKNILIISAFKAYCAINFFKGALLCDAEKLLVAPGENSQSGRQLRFTSVQQIIDLEPIVRSYIYEAIEVEKAGLKVKTKTIEEYAIPEELQQKLNADIFYKQAFDALTPGRQRGYILYFSQAKQAKTRIDRIEKSLDKIIKGKGFNER